MYRLGRRGHAKAKKRTWRIVVFVIAALLLIGGVVAFWVLRGLQQAPTVPQAVTREFADTRENTDRTFEQAGFSINLPADWVVREEAGPLGRYAWQATEKGADNRWLEVYTAGVPDNLAVNRLLPVTVEGGKIIVSGTVSDNCSTFGTQGVTPETRNQSNIVTKWQGIEFLCDMANYTRNVVGVGTADTQNRVLVTNEVGTQRTFIFVYTDHNIHPNYQILENALKSVTVL